ncbi:MAG: sensor histidine kinase [Bryobacteraceae bacterium]
MSQDPAALPSRGAGDENPAYDPTTVVRHIAHELRQPLSTIESIACYLEMVLPRTDGKARRQLAKLHQEVRQINWILCDALHFLRAAPLELQLLDLTEVVSKSLSEWGTLDGADIRLKLEQDLPLVRLDLEQTQHLLRNLVAFFGRLSAPQRSMILRTGAVGDEVILEVAAQLPEGSSADLDPLFRPFDSHLPDGSGLGLASVRKIAEAHGARLQAGTNPAGGISLAIAFPVGR